MNKWIVVIGVLVILIISAVVLIVLPGKTSAPTIPPIAGDGVVTLPASNATVTSPVTINGKALNTYFFEATFPIQILDQNGNVIGQGPAAAEGDWMTAGYVPFTAHITFAAQIPGMNGTIRLKNDNPSGDPANDKHVDFPIKF